MADKISFDTTAVGKRFVKVCSDQHGQDFLTQVRRIVDETSVILNRGGDATPQFTLHDSGHSARVLKIMGQIIPQKTLNLLSTVELGLLVLVAYTHDIGMCPPKDEIDSYRRLLLEGYQTPEHQPLLDRFADYAACSWDIESMPVQAPKGDAVDLSGDLITGWVRQEHCGEGWRFFQTDVLSTPGVLLEYDKVPLETILKRLSLSHGQPAWRLAETEFDLERVRTHRVCQRYLAIVLRIADILDYDPQRVPKILYRHQDVRNFRSVVEWHKHWGITSSIDDISDKCIPFVARPPNAASYAATLQMTKEIAEEVDACRRVTLQSPLPAGYLFTLAPPECNIKPEDGRYEFIDAAFRPDTDEILELLAGHRLYDGRRWVASRELLQNAFDAVVEKQARQKLHVAEHGGPIAPATDSVVVNVMRDGDTVAIEYTDTGVGMAREHFEKYIVKTGHSYRRSGDLASLRRRCREHGIAYRRVGRFGLGVLAYFMIAKEVVFSTRRDPICQSSDNSGWRFSTGGIAAFGQLEHVERPVPGTQVRLRLRRADEVAGTDHVYWNGPSTPDDSKRIIQILIHEFTDVFTRVPCKVIFQHEGRTLRSFDEGWVRSAKDVRVQIAEQLRKYLSKDEDKTPDHMMSSGELYERRTKQLSVDDFIKAAVESVRVKSRTVTAEGFRLQVHLPYFERGRVASLPLLEPEQSATEWRLAELYGKCLAWLPDTHIVIACQGAKVRTLMGGHLDPSPAFVTVDIDETLGSISVDRFEVALPPRLVEAIQKAAAAAIVETYLLVRPSLTPALIGLSDSVILEEPIRDGSKRSCWLVTGKNGPIWRIVRKYFVSAQTHAFPIRTNRAMKFRGASVDHAVAINPVKGDGGNVNTNWLAFVGNTSLVAGVEFPPAANGTDSTIYVPGALGEAGKPPPPTMLGKALAQFPPQWKNIVGTNHWILNESHWLVKLASNIDPQGLDRLRWSLRDYPSQERLATPLTAQECAVWLVDQCMQSDASTRLERVLGLHRHWFHEGWDAMSSYIGRDASPLVAHRHGGECAIFSRDGIEIVQHTDPRWNDFLPHPGQSWTVEVDWEHELKEE
ncbi:MAG: HD domain-containing protein [Armatimonadota bacterium]